MLRIHNMELEEGAKQRSLRRVPFSGQYRAIASVSGVRLHRVL
jgi:hypothetical protein